MAARDFYDILEIGPDASPEAIKAAYRRLTAFYHPDNFTHPDKQAYAHEKQKELNIAYDTLRDPAKRRAYDAERGHRGWQDTEYQRREQERRDEAEEREAEDRRRREREAEVNRHRAEEEARRRREAEERADAERRKREAEEARKRAQKEAERQVAWWLCGSTCVLALLAAMGLLRLWVGTAAAACGIIGWQKAGRLPPGAKWLAGGGTGLGGLAALVGLVSAITGNRTVTNHIDLPANPQRGATFTNPNDAAAMLYISPGEFTMGSDASDDEKPQRKVNLDGYWIYKREVTVAQYRKFCQATSRDMPEAPSWGWKDDHPVVNVSWEDATAYAKWAGVALPTEAQWEKAARGTDGRKYPWGNEWDDSKCANSEGSMDLNSTKPVGSYAGGLSPYGLHDMAGNVWEWCAAWYDENYYKNAPNRNPTGPASGTARALRGGSWILIETSNFRCAQGPS